MRRTAFLLSAATYALCFGQVTEPRTPPLSQPRETTSAQLPACEKEEIEWQIASGRFDETLSLCDVQGSTVYVANLDVSVRSRHQALPALLEGDGSPSA